jgi:hypothetical protein
LGADVKKPFQRLLAERQHTILTITGIANTTEFFVTGLRGHAPAAEHAVDLFVNYGEPAAQAVAHGVQHAKNRIQHREALMLCAVIMINFYIYH